ncbi:MAG: aldehyde dehydrogenase EutE [Oligoflexia bacterium]|nr:aldehyde dehydrogenase EutE [Oligoflexia bacterium]
MKINETQIDNIVSRVVEEYRAKQAQQKAPVPAPSSLLPPSSTLPSSLLSSSFSSSFPSSTTTTGCFNSIEEAVAASKRAFSQYQEISLEQRSKIISAIRKYAREDVSRLSQMAKDETGLGRVDDKIKKNLLAINKTPGIEDLNPTAFTGDNGLTIIEQAPYGVIGSISPCTNPSETIINNGIGMLAGGNTVVFNPHPSAKKTSAYTISLLNRAIISEGGPANLLTTIINPTIDSAQKLMTNPDIALLVVTGGPAVVKVAMKSGKRVIAAGPGNPPVVVDETADIEKAARDIIASASMDNNIICVLEKEIIVTEKAFNPLKKALLSAGAYELSQFHGNRLTRLLIDESGHPNKNFVGKDVQLILGEVGLQIDTAVRLAFVETEKYHPFAKTEMLMPILPLIRVNNIDEAIELAYNLEAGCRHTAVIHSRNIENMHKMAVKMNTSIFVKNGPALAGLAFEGEGPTSFTIASPTGEGVTTARHFVRSRRCVLSNGYFRIV